MYINAQLISCRCLYDISDMSAHLRIPYTAVVPVPSYIPVKK